MMKAAVIAAIFAVVGIGAFFAFRNPSPANVGVGLAGDSDTKPEINLPTKPWIEVIKPNVFTVSADGKQDEALQTGDEIENGTTIQADRKGLAALHMPDGSILRIDAESKFTIEESNFDPASDKLTVKVKHGGGRIWSKILALVTPESIWEVRTSNAVATVRGTAFGFAFVGGRSRILGSENTTKVDIIDPATGEIVPDTDITLGVDRFIEIRDEDAKKAAVNPKIIQARDAPAEVLRQEWVQRYKKEDRDYNQKFEDIKRESELEGEELRKLFRETVYKEFEADILKRREEKANPAATAAPTGDSDRSAPTGTPPATGRSVTPQTTTAVLPQSLELAARSNLNLTAEGDTVELEAFLTMSDGSRRNVTSEVNWQVIGPVGRMAKQGVFEARLDPSVAELGQAAGSIVATWQDKKTGEAVLGKTPIFNVRAKIEAPLEREG